MLRSKFVEWLDSEVPLKGKSVFEPGCGGGVFTVELAKRAERVTAVDGREDQLAAAKFTCGGLENIDYYVCNADWPFTFSADVTFHVGLLYHLVDPIRHLRRICDGTKDAVFLDTHIAAGWECKESYRVDKDDFRCLVRNENNGELRAGLGSTSRWLMLRTIVDELGKRFKNVGTVDLREERNGPRATILAKEKR